MPGWEQKPVTVLAVEVTWPASTEGELSQYELWTVTDYWGQVIVEHVQGFGGVVLPHTPSLVIVAFGISQTPEQLPQRAVQAALALRRIATQATDKRPAPELRMAVHWGQVLVDTGASDSRAHLLPIGDTLARPARLLGYGEPGEILASPEMERMVGGWCELRAREGLFGMGPLSQIGAYQVVGLRPLGSPLAMHRQRPLSQLVGRARELALLEDLLGQAREGQGQVVGIVGESGVGKSRLCYEFMRAHPTQGWLILETSADSYDQAIPYLPIIELLKSYFQIAGRDDASARRDKVTDKLRTLGHLIESSLPALLTLLNVPVKDAAWQALDPPQRRQRMLDAIKRLLIRESQVQPVFLVIENLHWIDGETQTLLNTLVEGLATIHLLLLVTYRPEYHHGWGSKTYYTQLRLDALPRVHAEALLDSLLGDDANLAPLRKILWQQTEGNPFFLEESVQTLVEKQVLVGARGAYRLTKPMQSIQVPATVQAVLAARIDRLPPQEKRLLQTAAVIGMEAPYTLLQPVAEISEEELRRGLTHLQATEFLYETSLFPDLSYTFKHTLTREVAYGSLLHERRLALHLKVVGALEARSPDRLSEHVERLAHHALRGELWEKAVLYCQQAGEKARNRGAFREALTAFEQALDALGHLSEHPDTGVLGIELRRRLGGMLSLVGEQQRSLAVLDEAEARARQLGDRARLGEVLSRMAMVRRIVGDCDGALAAGREALELAATLGNPTLHVHASYRLGQAYASMGDYRRAAEVLRGNVAALARSTPGYMRDWCISSQAWLAEVLGRRGEFAEGRRHGEEALRLARREAQWHGDVPRSVRARLGHLYLGQGDLEAAIQVFEEGIALCRASTIKPY